MERRALGGMDEGKKKIKWCYGGGEGKSLSSGPLEYLGEREKWTGDP
jgi:hypothetical protein